MQQKDKKIKIEERSSYIIVEVINEKLDLFDTPDVLASMEAGLKKRDFPHCIIDFKGVNHIDSTGIGLLIAVQNMLGKNGKKLAIIGIFGRVSEIFRITKMKSYFKTFESLEEAVCYVTGTGEATPI